MEFSENIISFVLDNRLVKVDFNNSNLPTTTVLNYLRILSNHKGVKEGCAEGDCGACTVVLGEVNGNNKIDYKAVDSCLIFLPMLHGKQLITVENIGTSKNLHPVQKAIVETNGSQCGFCTPGIIMSLFALYKNSGHPGKEEINDILTGNLCRCTGYRSIVEAAAISCVHNGIDHFTEKEPEIAKLLLNINQKNETILIITDKQKYFRPVNLKEALKLRNEYHDAVLIHGATDTALRVTKNKEILTEIIDISGVEELKQIVDNDFNISIGAGVNLEEVKSLSKKTFPALYKMLSVFGSRQIRHLATLGGNLGSASPIGDTIPVLMAYDATVVLESFEGKRKFQLVDFITGYRTTQLKPNEIITSVIIPKLKKELQVESYKISKRKDLDISTVSGGFRLKLDETNTINDILLAYGGMAAITKRADRTENFLKGERWDRETVQKAMELLNKDFTPISDARSSAEGRMVMARNLLLKFWTETNFM